VLRVNRISITLTRLSDAVKTAFYGGKIYSSLDLTPVLRQQIIGPHGVEGQLDKYVRSSVSSRMSSAIPEFGLAVPGQTYILRPGSYGLIGDGTGAIAVVLTPLGVFLPGGGQESDESSEAALIREVAEECGLAIQVKGFVGMADELVYGHEEQCYFRKRCSFFIAKLRSGNEPIGGEPDHQVLWLAQENAVSHLSHESQRWAVSRSREIA
jgi:hypothetical protein